MENYVEIATSMPIEISLPHGVVVPDTGVTTRKTEILLTASELEQVKKALESGMKLIQTRLNRTKKSMKRCTTTIEQNTVNSVLDKAERCKPVQVYPLEVLGVELEAIIYCLKRSRNSKSKDVQQLIASLSAYFDYEG